VFYELDHDLDSLRLHVDTFYHTEHTPTLSVYVKSCYLCVLPGESYLLSRSLLTVLLQFVVGQPGPLLILVPASIVLAVECAGNPFAPHVSEVVFLSINYVVNDPVLALTSTFVILFSKRCPVAPLVVGDAQHPVFSLMLLSTTLHHSALYRKVDRIIASYKLVFTFSVILLFLQIFCIFCWILMLLLQAAHVFFSHSCCSWRIGLYVT